MITNLVPVFLTGLFAGALTCLAVQGGLLAATIAQREEDRLKDNLARGGNVLPILSFLVAKLVAYTILGGLLGYLGSFFTLSIQTQVILYVFVGIFMIGTALNLLNVHPIFRYFIIQPPRFLTRLVRRESKSKNIFAPAVLGAFTVFIPCGTTQAMMALAIASGNPINGAAILFAFVLGTSPLFFILGYFATRLSGALHERFMKFAAFAIIILAVFNLNNAWALTGSATTIESVGKDIYCTLWFCKDSPIFREGVAGAFANETTINIEEAGYSPKNLSVQTGSKVTLKLKNTSGSGCTQAFTIPAMGIQKLIPLGQSDKISFVAPDKPGKIAFMCGMGMFRGVINVI